MSRRAVCASAQNPEQPPVIHPHAWYSRDEATALLRLRSSTLSTEVGKGRLRVSRRAGRYWFLGAWLIDWLAAGERPSRAPANGVSEDVSPATEG